MNTKKIEIAMWVIGTMGVVLLIMGIIYFASGEIIHGVSSVLWLIVIVMQEICWNICRKLLKK